MGLMARAARMAARQGREAITEEDIYAAMENKAMEAFQVGVVGSDILGFGCSTSLMEYWSSRKVRPSQRRTMMLQRRTNNKAMEAFQVRMGGQLWVVLLHCSA
jgi:hypothetical protein